MTETARTLADEFRRHAQVLRAFIASGWDAVPGDVAKTYAFGFAFVLAIQAVLDLAAHVCALEALRTDGSYADSIRALAEKGHLDHGSAEKLRAAAGTRNLLVHRYRIVDHARVWTDVTSGLDAIEEAAKTLVRAAAAHDRTRGGEAGEP